MPEARTRSIIRTRPCCLIPARQFSKILIAKCLEECDEVVLSEYELIDRKQTAQKLIAFYLYVQAFILSQMCSKNDSNLEIINTIKLYANILKKTMLEEDSQENTGLF